MKAKKGISLIVLVITIIVIIILAGAVILNLSQNNPMSSAKISSLVQSRDSLDSATLLYIQKVMAETNGNYDVATILKGAATTGTPSATPVAKTQIGTSNYYEIDPTLLGMTLPTAATGAKWIVDVNSGKCLLNVAGVTTLPDYMADYATSETLKDFVTVQPPVVTP